MRDESPLTGNGWLPTDSMLPAVALGNGVWLCTAMGQRLGLFLADVGYRGTGAGGAEAPPKPDHAV